METRLTSAPRSRSASNVAGAAEAAASRPQTGQGAQDRPSIIMVEVLGFGGSDGSDGSQRRLEEDERRKRSDNNQGYDPNSAFRLIGNGALDSEQKRNLTEGERNRFNRQVERSGAL